MQNQSPFRTVAAIGLVLAGLPAGAATFAFEAASAGVYSVFSGTFEAHDLNGDNRITSAEILSFQATARGGSYGGPSGWSVNVVTDASTFFRLRYNLDGTLGNNVNEFLEFGYRRSVSCSPVTGAPPTASIMQTGLAALDYIKLPSKVAPYQACPVTDGDTSHFPAINATVSPLAESLEASPVPVPLGAALLLSGLALLGLRRRRGAHA